MTPEETSRLPCTAYTGNEPFMFASYAHEDKQLVYPEIERLHRMGYRIWYDEGIRPSSDWPDEVAANLARCSLFLVFLSSHAIASRNVLNEIHFALERGKQFLAIHLTQVTLPDSLELQVGRIQAFLKHTMTEERFSAQLSRWLPADLRQPGTEPPITAAAAEPAPVVPAATAAVAAAVIQIPSFHYGSVVPPDYFIGREEEIEEASRLIRANHGLLLVGNRRAGKTSFCTKLIHEIMGRPGNDVLAAYLNLQQCTELTLETFLEHTLLNLIGEMARQVFHCRYSDLLRPNPAVAHGRRHNDPDFVDFVDLFARVKERTHTKRGARPSPLLASEFIQLSHDLLQILRAKRWRSCVIFYDEANRLPPSLSVDLLVSNEETLNTAGLISVFAASPELEKSIDDLRDILGHHLHLGPFRSLEDLRRLLSRYCCEHPDQGGEPPAEPAAVDLLWKYSQGLPYAIQLLAGLSFRLAHDQRCPCVFARHVEQAYVKLHHERPELF
jgi:hypothetical protein